MEQIAQYENGNCLIKLYSDGTKKRYVKTGETPKPLFPENMDIKITNWCDADCDWCHEASNKSGKHADLYPVLSLLQSLPPGVEVAIGGGHPLSHPDFKNFLVSLHSMGLISNVTINERHFDESLFQLEEYIAEGLIKGVGYSYQTKPCTWEYEHLVTHVIAGITPFSELGKIIEVNKKILLLGYKNFRKGMIYGAENLMDIQENIQSWADNLHLVTRSCQISFDNLAIEQTRPQRLFPSRESFLASFMGEEGQYSMYIDAVRQVVARASFENERKGFISGDIRATFAQIQTEVRENEPAK